MFNTEKTGMIGLPHADENMMIILSCLDTVPERDRWTDGIAISISRVLTCDKNGI